MDEEVARARQVWRDAQAKVVDASARRFECLTKEELKEALDAYENAVELMTAAKNHYDIVRAEARNAVVKCLPRAG